jgi:hypothetical protein
MAKKTGIVRIGLLLAGGALCLSGWLPLIHSARVHADNTPGIPVKLDASGIQPRQLEQSTGEAVVREYAKAWQSMAAAIEQNRADLLNDSFVGNAHDTLASQIEWQKKSGLSVRYVDHGHELQGIFYSPEGSAIEVRDTAHLEIQILDGGKVVSSQAADRHYIGIMTVADDRWKVRVLESVP